ncbi:hypothetical protein C8Q74DRAFT_1276620 [Fomes fomentarius]|nr:hypothetical protein C8Q74DRAFT_1276620 [Fomes fomentarius]
MVASSTWALSPWTPHLRDAIASQSTRYGIPSDLAYHPFVAAQSRNTKRSPRINPKWPLTSVKNGRRPSGSSFRRSSPWCRSCTPSHLLRRQGRSRDSADPCHLNRPEAAGFQNLETLVHRAHPYGAHGHDRFLSPLGNE